MGGGGGRGEGEGEGEISLSSERKEFQKKQLILKILSRT